MLNEEINLLQKNSYRFSKEIQEKIDEIINICKDFYDNKSNFTNSYTKLFQSVIDKFKISNLISEKYGGKLEQQPFEFKNESIDSIETTIRLFNSSLTTYSTLTLIKYDKRNKVIVGANGSGKTTLVKNLSKYLPDNASIFQAERGFWLESDSINLKETVEDSISACLDNNINSLNSHNRGNYAVRQFEYSIMLFNRYQLDEYEKINVGILKKENSKCNAIISKWNDLIRTRYLFFDQKLKVRTLDNVEYNIKLLSSGEKALLFFLINILLLPKKSFYFIDEPENNLNPSISIKLWDFIERYLNDSIFIYLSHNPDFVESRFNAEIYWMKNYDGKNWNYQLLPKEENLPQNLIVELVGNKMPIIFCESKNSKKLDAKLYRILFDNFKIIPCGGCKEVIEKAKAYYKLGLPQIAYGIIDCDYDLDSSLKQHLKHNVFTIPYFEIENFLLSSEIVKNVINYYKCSNDTYDKILKEIQNEFAKFREVFIARYSAYELQKSRIYNGSINTLISIEKLEDECKNTIKQIDLNAVFQKYGQLYDSIDQNCLDQILRYYDNKNMLKQFRHIFSFKNNITYEDAVFNMLSSNAEIKNLIISKYFDFIKFS